MGHPKLYGDITMANGAIFGVDDETQAPAEYKWCYLSQAELQPLLLITKEGTSQLHNHHTI